MIFWLGTCEPSWLRRTTSPLFLSRRRLVRQKTFHRATCPWALDSGGFSELSLFGRWTVTAAQYVEEVRRWQEAIGSMLWAAAQDWMCEPWILDKTGGTVSEHQSRTVENYCELRRLAPELSFVPVLQGWTYDDYQRCRELYAAAGVDLAALPLVGLGSVCRRQATNMAEELIRDLSADGIRLHGFGFKLDGLRRVAGMLASSDSMAWSLAARKESGPLPGCTHRKCANCFRYAMRWRERVVGIVQRVGRRPVQPTLF